MKIMMPEQEARTLEEEYSKADCILEFGSGGSTVLASRLGKKVFSVESDKAWADRMAKETSAAIHYCDIGPTKAHGHPKDRTMQHKWPEYPISVWDRSDFVHPDLILIDGRFRVACFLVALVRIKRETLVLFDDFERSQYKVVKEFFKPISENRLSIFKIKPNKFDFSKISILSKSFFQKI